METKKYNWIQKGFAKGIDPDLAILELERIENVFGSLTAENILKASEPEEALFHSLFTWNDSEAANQYRLSQARTIINNIEVRILSNGEEKHIPVFEIVTREEGRVYKHISDFTKEDIESLKSNAVKSLNFWKNKLSNYKQFDVVVQKIGEAINEAAK